MDPIDKLNTILLLKMLEHKQWKLHKYTGFTVTVLISLLCLPAVSSNVALAGVS